jgi:hypothetical protein
LQELTTDYSDFTEITNFKLSLIAIWISIRARPDGSAGHLVLSSERQREHSGAAEDPATNPFAIPDLKASQEVAARGGSKKGRKL